jgi:hypothetical protein
MRLEINGRVVEVDDSFAELSPEDQQKTVNEIASSLSTGPAVPVEPPKSQVRQEAEGVGMMLAVPAAQALQTAIENPIKTGLGAYGTYKTAQLANAGIDALRNVKAPPPVAPVAPVSTAPVAPVAPVAPAASPILDAQGRPMARAPVPTPAAAPAKAPAPAGVLDKATQMVRQLAASRLVQGAGALAVGLGTPGNVGQNYPFPQTGPLAGSEINPGTGRPWTPQELDAYRARYGG